MDYRTNINQIASTKKGFTLLEALVAIFVLLIGLVGAMSLTQRSIAIATTFRERIIATGLAQEAIEAIRNTRDTHVVLFNTPFAAPCFGDVGCVYNTKVLENEKVRCTDTNPCYLEDPFGNSVTGDLTFTQCAGDCPRRVYLDGNNTYRQDGAGTETIYRREIYLRQLDTVSVGDSLISVPYWELTVRVTWVGRFNPNGEVVLTTALAPHL